MRVTVELGPRAYDVSVGEGVRHELADLIARRAPKAQSAVLLTSPSLAARPWFDLSSGVDQHVIRVPDGEDAKTMVVFAEVLEEVASRRLSREDVIVGVGGGAVTDLAGFVAASYLRGVALVQVPTSLVGQVDAAIGGKTGVNLRAGKNLAGAFHQPLGVLCDTEVLASLPDRERVSGLGEVAKCWLLERRGVAELASVSLGELIEGSIRLKAAIVAGDERESGRRALLNYGHTLAHAMEAIALRRSADELRHGEAVAVGLAFAARLAHALGRVAEPVVSRHDEVLDALGLERRLTRRYDVDDLIEAMGHDKKAHHDLSFVLDGAEGYSVVTGVERRVVRDALVRFQEES